MVKIDQVEREDQMTESGDDSGLGKDRDIVAFEQCFKEIDLRYR